MGRLLGEVCHRTGLLLPGDEGYFELSESDPCGEPGRIGDCTRKRGHGGKWHALHDPIIRAQVAKWRAKGGGTRTSTKQRP